MLAITRIKTIDGETKYEILDTNDYTKEFITLKQLIELHSKGHTIEGFKQGYTPIRYLRNWYIEQANTYILETTDINHWIYVYKDNQLVVTIADLNIRLPKSEMQYIDRPELSAIVLLKDNKLLLYFDTDCGDEYYGLYYIDLNTRKYKDLVNICNPYLPERMGEYLDSGKAFAPRETDINVDWYYTGYETTHTTYFKYKDSVVDRLMYIEYWKERNIKLGSLDNQFLSNGLLDITTSQIDRYIKIKLINFHNKLMKAFDTFNYIDWYYILTGSENENDWVEFTSKQSLEALLHTREEIIECYLKAVLHDEICMILKDCNIMTFDFVIYSKKNSTYLEIQVSNFGKFKYNWVEEDTDTLYKFYIDKGDTYKLIQSQI